MIPPVIVIRPEPGCSATVAAACALGMEALGFALFEIASVAWDAPDPATIDALLLGSANAPRHAGPALAQFAGMPAYVVGAATAEAARVAGLAVVAIGDGSLPALLDSRLAGNHRHLLRLMGEEHLPLVPPAGVTISERVVYTARALPMPAALARLLRTRELRGIVVLVHSAAAMRHFAAECARYRVTSAHIRLAMISERVADAAGPGWAGIATAATPDDGALLALALHLCHSGLKNDRPLH